MLMSFCRRSLVTFRATFRFLLLSERVKLVVCHINSVRERTSSFTYPALSFLVPRFVHALNNLIATATEYTIQSMRTLNRNSGDYDATLELSYNYLEMTPRDFNFTSFPEFLGQSEDHPGVTDPSLTIVIY